MIKRNLMALFKCITVVGAFVSVSMGFLIPTYLELFTDMATWSSLIIYMEEYIMNNNEKKKSSHENSNSWCCVGGYALVR